MKKYFFIFGGVFFALLILFVSYLTITASKNSENDEEDEKKNYIRRERVYGKYERSFYLGDLDQDKIDATFTDGCLKITVPKKTEEENKKIIEIK